MIKLLLITLGLFCTTFAQSNTGKDSRISTKSHQIQTVVLDAGHGGKDDGCSGAHSKEKHLALNITLALGEAIENAFPSVNVVYTRTTDIFIPLHARAAIANDNDADLFISIHCNAIRKLPNIRGTETFVKGIPSDDTNSTASRENQSVFLEEDYQQRYFGFDRATNEAHIFTSIFQNAYLDRSILLAEKIEKYVLQYSKRKSRGVRQDDFVVLRETNMPSVLVETGFLTNERDEQYLYSKAGQKNMAYAIFLAFKEYKGAIEQEVENIVFSPDEAIPPSLDELESTPPIEEETIVRTESVAENVYLSMPVQKEVVAAPYRANEPEPEPLRESNNQSIAEENSIAHEPIEKEYKPELPVTDNQNKVEIEENNIAPQSIEQELSPTTEPEKQTDNKSVLYFTVQLAASLTPLDINTPKWQQLAHLEVRQEKQFHKYLAGHFTNYESAAESRLALTKMGFKGAFVVAYRNGQRVSLAEFK